VVKLIKNFRSHPSILKFPNERFYGGDLVSCGDGKIINAYIGSKHLVNRNFPIVFYGISGKDDREASSPSFFNISEASTVRDTIDQLRSDRTIRISKSSLPCLSWVFPNSYLAFSR
jgi:helicase MOV-10